MFYSTARTAQDFRREVIELCKQREESLRNALGGKKAKSEAFAASRQIAMLRGFIEGIELLDPIGAQARIQGQIRCSD